jgi:hypothetical protein
MIGFLRNTQHFNVKILKGELSSMIKKRSLVLAWTSNTQKGLVLWDKAKTIDGYVIFNASALKKTVLVDINGNLVRMWDGNGQEMLPPELANGELGHVLVKYGLKVQERDWDNNVVWEYNAKELKQHHDWQKLPNGNYLILGSINVPKDKIPTKFHGPGIEGEKEIKMVRPIYGDRITEINPEGEIVWDWFAHDHLDVSKACGYSSWYSGRKAAIYYGDWTHFNAIHYCTNPGYEDKIVVSNRHHNEALLIDKKSGEIVWQWGEDLLGHQHDVQMIEPGHPGHGNVLLFDNGYHSKVGISVSQVLEVDPKTSKVVWSFVGVNPTGGSLRSLHISGCQRLPNGNTFITEGETGRLFEVTREKEIVWEYINPFYKYTQGKGMINEVFKARKVLPSWVPRDFDLTPEMVSAMGLMGQAKSHGEAMEALVQQASQILLYTD